MEFVKRFLDHMVQFALVEHRWVSVPKVAQNLNNNVSIQNKPVASKGCVGHTKLGALHSVCTEMSMHHLETYLGFQAIQKTTCIQGTTLFLGQALVIAV